MNKVSENPSHKNEWVLVDWDGNRDLGYQCWEKKFGRGHVSVGVGEFETVAFDYGANSDNSYSATRWRAKGPPMSEQEAMEAVDRGHGKKMVLESSPTEPQSLVKAEKMSCRARRP